MKFGFLSITVAFLCLFISPIYSAELTDMPAGSKVENVVAIGKSQIPLPKGEWELLAAHNWRRGGLGKIGEAVLSQDSGESGFHFAFIRGNVELSSCRGWKRWNRLCDRKDTHHNSSDRNYNPKDASCWNLNHRVMSSYKNPKSEFQKKINLAIKERRMAGVTYIRNEFFKSSRCHFVVAMYYSDPEHFGFPLEKSGWTNNAWHRDRLNEDPRREKFVAAAKEAGQRLQDAVEKGFERELDSWTSDIALKFE